MKAEREKEKTERFYPTGNDDRLCDRHGGHHDRGSQHDNGHIKHAPSFEYDESCRRHPKLPHVVSETKSDDVDAFQSAN